MYHGPSPSPPGPLQLAPAQRPRLLRAERRAPGSAARHPGALR